MKDIHAVKGRFLIERLVAEGEHECQDFKYKISDARKIARSLSAFANHKGGRLLIGVKDNGVIAGVRSEEDIFMIETAARSFCRPEPAVSFKAYKATDDGAVVVIATVEPIPDASEYICVKEQDGHLQAYIRVADENIAMPPYMMQARSLRGSIPGITLGATSPEAAVIDTINALGGEATLDQVLKKVKASRLAATDAIVRLLAISALRSTYSAGAFRLSFPT
ncbi:MAG: ATP-binding protein [Muribaculaceae bacterium]|nr:ATP-binding protein [Muribaculaceae bacterium]